MLVKYTQIIPYLDEALKRVKDRNFKPIHITNFPMCIKLKLSNLKDLEGEKILPESFLESTMAKPPKCDKCKFINSCCGVWKGYLENFGDEELMPLCEDKIESSEFMDKGKIS